MVLRVQDGEAGASMEVLVGSKGCGEDLRGMLEMSWDSWEVPLMV